MPSKAAEEFQLHTARKRFFLRFCKLYHQGVPSDMECPDAPELVALLQAIGFNLLSLKFEETATAASSGCRVIIKCSESGARAELQSPPDVNCRCTRFCKSGTQPNELREKASCWQVTTSQESLNNASFGSSILPEMPAARQTLIREVVQLLQEELDAPAPPPSAERPKSRLSTPLKSANHRSFESLEIDRVSMATRIERRASFGCCEDLQQRNLHADDALNWSPLSSVSIASTVQSNVANRTFTISPTQCKLRSHIQDVVKSANEALKLLSVSEATSKRVLSRKSTFVIEKLSSGTENSTKKARFAPPPPPRRTPPPPPRRTESLRLHPCKLATPNKPPIPVPQSEPPKRRSTLRDPSSAQVASVSPKLFPKDVSPKPKPPSTVNNVFKRLSSVTKKTPTSK